VQITERGVLVRRAAVILGALVLIVGVLLEPTTFSATGADAAFPAPWWQTGIAIADVALIAACAGWAFEQRFRKAQLALIAEGAFNACVALGYTLRDGADHFEGGFASSYRFSVYLSLIAVRFLVIAVLAVRTTTLDVANT
jgi:hypothetical protein